MVLLKKLNHINKNENDIVREFHTRFQKLSQQIPRTYRPRPQFLIFLYIRAFSRQSKLMLDKKGPRSIQEAYDMATEVEANISSSKEEQSFVPEVNIDEPKDTPDILKKIHFLETFVEEFLKRLEQGINKQEV
jgi:molybdopterin-guanine dinucleotide biosynthesis protein A